MQSNFEQAIISYHAADREAALELLEQCLQVNPGDWLANMYLQCCL